MSRTDYNRLGCALLLKYFQMQGRFPRRKQDIPAAIVEHIAQQLRSGKRGQSVFHQYAWTGRTVETHRSQIRRRLGFRVGTIADAQAVLAWMTAQDRLLEEHDFDRLQAIASERYKELKIEPPPSQRLGRLIRSAAPLTSSGIKRWRARFPRQRKPIWMHCSMRMLPTPAPPFYPA